MRPILPRVIARAIDAPSVRLWATVQQAIGAVRSGGVVAGGVMAIAEVAQVGAFAPA